VETLSTDSCMFVQEKLQTQNEVSVVFNDCVRTHQLVLAGQPAPGSNYPSYCMDDVYPAEHVRNVITVAPQPWQPRLSPDSLVLNLSAPKSIHSGFHCTSRSKSHDGHRNHPLKHLDPAISLHGSRRRTELVGGNFPWLWVHCDDHAVP